MTQALQQPLPVWPAGDPVTPVHRLDVPAWRVAHERHRRELARWPRDQQPIVFLGDSTVSCWTEAGRGRVPWAQHFAGRAINLGVSGDEVKQVRWRLANHEWTGITPSAVVVSVGANHRYRADATEGYRAALDALLRDIRSQWPGMQIVLLLLPWSEKPGGVVSPVWQDCAAQLRGMVRYAAVSVVVPPWVDRFGQLPRRYCNDGVHPTRAGYQQLSVDLACLVGSPRRPARLVRLTEPLARLLVRLHISRDN